MAYRYPTIKVDGKTKLKHRHIAESVIGRELRDDEDVHHRDHDGHNTSPENLEVMPSAEHRRMHADERLIHPREKACEICGAAFTPHPTKRKRQKTCSPACANELRSRTEKATKRRPQAAYMPLLDAAE